MDWEEAFLVVDSRDARVAVVVERVWDWETAKRRVCGISAVFWVRVLGIILVREGLREIEVQLRKRGWRLYGMHVWRDEGSCGGDILVVRAYKPHYEGRGKRAL